MDNNNVQVLIFIFMILLSLTIILFIYFSLRQVSFKKEIFDLNEDLSIKEEMLKNRNSRIIKLRKMNHDNEKELQFLKSLIDNKKYIYASSHLEYLLYRDDPIKNTVKKIQSNEEAYFEESSKNLIDLISESIIDICKEHNIDYKYYSNNILLENIINPSDLNTIIVNILNNAVESLLNIDTNKNKYIRLYTYQDNLAYYMDIKNNGPKINNTKLIFRESYSSSKKEDHGFGLTIVKEILDKYGGNIYVKSDEIVTSFTIIFPKYNL